MGLSSLSLMLFSIYILSTIVKFHLVVANSLQSYTPPCSADEHSALLQFKQSFVIDTSASSYYYYDGPKGWADFVTSNYGAYPKTLSWKSNKSCCSWDGVTCDEETGHVIGLDLSGSCLYGSINSSSSLFRLVHLESLNFAYNDFNSSQIPPTIRNFPRLRYLNFSYSGFSGRVPSEISHLSKLSSFSIMRNNGDNQIFSNKGFFRSLAQNLSSLEILELSNINISSTVPDTIANLSHLTTLVLFNCYLSGNLPISLGNFRQLIYLDLSSNDIFGQIPLSFGNLSQLTTLGLVDNQLSGHIPASFGNLTQLTSLFLYSNQFSGPIPAFLGYLTRLKGLLLGINYFNSSIPRSLFNLVNLQSLGLRYNNLSGTIEFHKFLKLQNLTSLGLSGNKLEVLMGSTSMNNATTVVPKFEYLGLSGCNISEFPDFLRFQDSLIQLDLSGNRLHGRVPKWMWNTSTQTLRHLNISHNFLSGFDRPPFTIPWVNLELLDLASNSLVGEIPSLICNASTLYFVDLKGNRLSGVLPQCLGNSNNDLQYLYLGNNNLTGKVLPQICNLTKLSYLDLSSNKLSSVLPQCLENLNNDLQYLILGNNNLTGKVSLQICNLTKLYYLDLSSNKLSGMLPQCLGPVLEYLNLANNSFHGILPQRFTTAGCDLSMIDVSHNKLQGQLPRSLANCASLEFLVLSNNQFYDVFPLWLGTLQQLKILAMRHNGFYGVIGHPKKNFHFPELRILDLSHNSFKGKFPAEYIFTGNAVRGITIEQDPYDSYDHYLQCSISITNKGIEINYPKIQEDLVAIHLSGNKFEGNIPEFIGKLKGLRLLNISNNFFTGCIPSSVGNLTVLESLDLSHNQLSGEIPQQLSQLFFLENFNVSHNNLTGRIPGGTQLSTFDITSFEGNPGLCGEPLPKKCENPEGINLPPSTSNPDGSRIEIDWKFALAGLGSGFVVGVVLADVAITRWDEWFLEVVDMLIRLVKRIRRCRN